MEITVRNLENGVAVLHLAGRLNLVSANDLRAAVQHAVANNRTRIAVDLSGVEFLDSSGLGALIGGVKTTRQAGGELRIAAPTEQVKLVLQLTNMERVLPAYPDAVTAFDA